MPATLTVRDKSLMGEELGESLLQFPAERISVRELIRSRIYQEVSDFNCVRTVSFRGLVTPTEMELALNGDRTARARPVDWKQQFELACRAFERNQILILVAERQVASLEEEFDITPSTVVTFLKLTLLVGG